MKGGYAALNTVAIDSKRRIVLAGYVVSSRVGHLALVRYLPDGRLDKSFGDHGKVIRKFPFFSDGSIALDSRNRIVAGASDLNHHFELLRFRVGGTRDKSFGSGGVVTTNISGSLTTVMIDRQDRILAAGQGFDSPVVLARFRPSGRPDRDFGTDGVVNSSFGGPGATYVYDGAIGVRGRIVVAGRNNRRFALARYKPNGVLDPSFGEHGVVEKPGGTADALAVDSKGRPVAAGLHDGRFAVARYTGP